MAMSSRGGREEKAAASAARARELLRGKAPELAERLVQPHVVVELPGLVPQLGDAVREEDDRVAGRQRLVLGGVRLELRKCRSPRSPAR